MSKIAIIQQEALTAIVNATTISGLEELRVYYLGRKGVVTQLLQQIATVAATERAEFGQAVNNIKTALTGAINDRKTILSDQVLQQKLQTERLDITLAGIGQQYGPMHPCTPLFLVKNT